MNASCEAVLSEGRRELFLAPDYSTGMVATGLFLNGNLGGALEQWVSLVDVQAALDQPRVLPSDFYHRFNCN